jgi:hypothetical protein
MRRRTCLLFIGFAASVAACGPAAEPAPTASATAALDTPFAITAQSGTVIPVTPIPPDQITPVTYVAPTATPIPPLPGGAGPTELKYRVLAEFPDFFFCDPDFYPVARADEMDLARQRFPEIQANTEEFNTILAHNNLLGGADFTDEQILLIYREHKRLAALFFTITPEGYQFQIQVGREEGEGERITGVIDAQGAITIQQREPALLTCPICLAAGTLIDTPHGPAAVENVQPGMLVWTVDESGARVAMPVLRVGSTFAPASHQVIHLILDDGRELFVSAGHPTADGRQIGQLRVGDSLAGARIAAVERIPYPGGATYDLLPAGETGFYWANGILIGSTLAGE